MTRYTARGGVPTARREFRPRPERIPDLQPTPGHYLLAGINAVLAAGAPQDARRQADELRAALARTAACGDTCRVRPAADAVRLAAALLLAGRTGEGRDLLARTMAGLRARPLALPAPRLGRTVRA